MTITISRLYDTYSDAERAVSRLEAAGVPHSDISIVANNSDNWYGSSTGKVDRDRDGVDDRAEGAGTGAGIGAGLGSAAGLLAGLGLLAIPGLGPGVAAGWLGSTRGGAAAGAATGGIVGALTEAGVSKDDASRYAEGVRRGGTLVSARVPAQDRYRLHALLPQKAGKPPDGGPLCTKRPGTGRNGAPPGKNPAGTASMPQARRCRLTMSAVSASCTAMGCGADKDPRTKTTARGGSTQVEPFSSNTSLVPRACGGHLAALTGVFRLSRATCFRCSGKALSIPLLPV